MDKNYEKLSRVLCRHSMRLGKGEHVMFDLWETPAEMVAALIAEASSLGAFAHVRLNDSRVSRALALSGAGERLALDAECDMFRIKKMNAYCAIRGSSNIFEMSDVSPDRMAEISSAMKESVDWRVNKTKWVVLRWPSAAMAQLAQMSVEAFGKFYFDVCTMDYDRMDAGAAAMKSLMEKTDKVWIRGNGTDLHFSIKGMRANPCAGQYNIPDGEIYTAPVRDSVEGVVRYNAPTVYNGVSFDSIELEFSKGKIVRADSPSNVETLRKILSCDDGASYVGEFAMGFNPYVTRAMRDILFDEKIAGSFHFTPGQAYVKADNGNRSRIHWDMVCIQTPECGGGEILFDGKVVRKDGLFIGEGIDKLNPSYLLG